MINRQIEMLDLAKDRLVSDSGIANAQGRPLMSEQWDGLLDVANEICEACRNRNLQNIAIATRKMKNRLRKRQIRRRLEMIEEEERGAQGDCKCSCCGKVLDDSKDPCIHGALCSECALEKGEKRKCKDALNKDDNKNKNKNDDKKDKDIGESVVKLRLSRY